jgi:flavodoxin
MKILIIYDSYFGNTELVAKKISEALASQNEVQIVKVSEVRLEELKDFDLVLFGSPTRGFKASESTLYFVNSIPAEGLKGLKVAVFDTRIAAQDIKPAIFRFIVKRGGYAADKLATALVKLGAELVIPAEPFYVKESEGPLKDGELEHATLWGQSLLEKII